MALLSCNILGLQGDKIKVIVILLKDLWSKEIKYPLKDKLVNTLNSIMIDLNKLYIFSKCIMLFFCLTNLNKNFPSTISGYKFEEIF